MSRREGFASPNLRRQANGFPILCCDHIPGTDDPGPATGSFPLQSGALRAHIPFVLCALCNARFANGRGVVLGEVTLRVA